MRSKGIAIVTSGALLFGLGLVPAGSAPITRSRLTTGNQTMGNIKPGNAAGLRPLIALVVHNPLTWILKSGEPVFVLYDDGTVIYAKRSRGDGKYVSAKLSLQRMSGLLRRVRRQTDP